MKKGRPQKNMAAVIKNDLNKKMTLEFGRSKKSGPEQRRIEKKILVSKKC